MPGIKEIEEIWNSRQPIIWVNTFEERRVIEEIVHSPIVGITKEEGDEVGKINPRKKLFMWSCTQGLVEIKGDQFQNFDTLKTADMQTLQPVVAMDQVASDRLNYETHDGSILIMRDLHKLMNIPMPARKMRDIIKHLSITMKTIFIVGPSNEIPDELQKDIYYVDFDYPDATLIRNILDVIVGGIKKKAKVDKKDERFHIARSRGKDMRYRTTYSEEEISDIVKSAQGLTRSEITIAFSKSINNTSNGEIEYLRVAEEKKNIIKRSQVLEIWTRTEPMKDVGGNGELKTWLEERGNAVTGKASNFGVRPPKGCLITGVQGGGKSMIAKAVAGMYRLPLIRLDFGRIFAGLVGSSEKNTRNMISQVEAMAPAVLWIDEIEKGLSGTGSSNMSDGGTSSRVFGTFISWLQDKTKPVFVIATANDVSQLPAELLRKGRFDAIWFVDLPTKDERREIYRIHLQRIKPVGRDPNKFDLDKLAKICYERNGESFDYSGAEIEEAINDALFAKYSEAKAAGVEEEKIIAGSKYDITTDDIVEALLDTIPISCTAQEKITKIRKWGQRHARFASSKAKEAVDGSITKKLKKGEKATAKFTADDLDITSGP